MSTPIERLRSGRRRPRPLPRGEDRILSLLAAQEVSRAGYVRDQRRMAFGGRQDIMKTLGYAEQPTFEDYFARYLRQGVAARIIDLPVNKTWGGGPLKIEGFPAWEDLSRTLSLKAKLAAVDRLAGIGEFAVLLLGVRPQAGEDVRASDYLERPIEKVSKPSDILFAQQFGRNAVRIVECDDDPGSPRFSLPTLYEIDIPSGYISTKTLTTPIKSDSTRRVHWTRIIHVVADELTNEVVGIPRLMRIIDDLHNLDKTVGGASEMFWQGADRALVANMAQGFSGGAAEKDDIKAQLEEFYLGLRRILTLRGVDVKSLESVQPDPSGIVDSIFTLISAGSGIPKRILFGSERGELASVQDRNNFADTIAERRENYAEPFIVRKLLERFELWGLLKNASALPVQWPTLDVLSPQEKAELAERRTMAAVRAEQAAAFGPIVSTVAELRWAQGHDPDATDDLTGVSRVDTSVDEADPTVGGDFKRVKGGGTVAQPALVATP